MTAPAAAALAFGDVAIEFRSRGAWRAVLRGVSFSVAPGEAYGLVGESGCGKSTAALAAVRALPAGGRVSGGRISVGGQDVAGLDAAGLRRLRREAVATVYQDASRALNPALTVARQVSEVFEAAGVGRAEARARAEAMLARVRIAAPGRVMGAYPHQLSGGMAQRVVIAMALARDPALLILDEPTTALDATVEAEVLDLLGALRRESGTALLFISHNLGVVRRMCDRVGVLYGGCLVEEATAADLMARPLHPYTQRLLGCLPVAGRRKSDGALQSIPGFPPPPGALPPGCVFAPRCSLADEACRAAMPPLGGGGAHRAACFHAGEESAAEAMSPGAAAVRPVGGPVLRAERLSRTYRSGGRAFLAVRDVSFDVAAGETLGLVGESGCGKTTLARLLLGLAEPDPGGVVTLNGCATAGRAAGRSRADLTALQVVFQNPDTALNRAHTTRRLIGRAVRRLARLSGGGVGRRVAQLAEAVRLAPEQLPLQPRQLSGGLKQRVAIARAFAGEPAVVICDEPTSALDVSVQASILNLLAGMQAQAGVSYILISHDLGVVRYMADRIGVLYAGRLLEIGPAEAVFDGPHHPYTEALLSAGPTVDGSARTALAGEPPDPLAPPPGCVFSPRCHRHIGPICDTVEPVLGAEPHAIRCHLPRGELGRKAGPGGAHDSPSLPMAPRAATSCAP